jgi:hypothetical protein
MGLGILEISFLSKCNFLKTEGGLILWGLGREIDFRVGCVIEGVGASTGGLAFNGGSLETMALVGTFGGVGI